ncbi:MAG: hypothetical protein ACP5RP_00100 [Candidatus Micrarchaeia archaeon]
MKEAELVEKTIVLRNLRVTKEVTETRRSLVRWLALSLGIINPGESRSWSIPVFDALLYFQFELAKDPTIAEISEYIGKRWSPINEKTLRYHLLQLKKASFVQNSKGKFFFTLPPNGEKYDIRSWMENYFNSEINPVKEKIIETAKSISNKTVIP